METIQMVDLKNQYLKIKSEIDAEISKVLHSSAFINRRCKRVSNGVRGVFIGKTCYPLCQRNGRIASIVNGLDLQPGDEVITTPFTFFATAECSPLLKLTPVFVDVEENSFNINANKIEGGY